MIDTVVLIIPFNEFKVLDYDAFKPSAKGFLEPPYIIGLPKCVQNPTKEDKKNGVYKPRLTISKQPRIGCISVALKIEFSAPKLLYGNNFDELEETDFDSVLKTLHKRLAEMHVIVSIDSLRHASVVGIHYGKNIVFTDYTTSSLIINIIAKLDVSTRLDAGNTDYRNNGQAIRYHTNSYELVFYDKMKDLQQGNVSERRSLESDNYVQSDLFKNKKLKGRFEVLRMELRFNGKRKLKDTMKKLGLDPELTEFHHLFKEDIARKMLMHFWAITIDSSLNVVLLAENKAPVLLHKLLSHGLKDAKALQVMGALMVISEQGQGIRGLKKILSETGNTYKRLEKELKDIDLLDNYLYTKFDTIGRNISELEAIKIVNYNELKGIK